MKELIFDHHVKEKLGGVAKVAELTKKCVTRGFDSQLYLKKTHKGCNLIKVTTENDKIEVMFYHVIEKKSFKKLDTVEVKSLDDIASVITNKTGIVF